MEVLFPVFLFSNSEGPRYITDFLVAYNSVGSLLCMLCKEAIFDYFYIWNFSGHHGTDLLSNYVATSLNKRSSDLWVVTWIFKTDSVMISKCVFYRRYTMDSISKLKRLVVQNYYNILCLDLMIELSLAIFVNSYAKRLSIMFYTPNFQASN